MLTRFQGIVPRLGTAASVLVLVSGGAVAVIPATAAAQQAAPARTGRITGRVVDAKTGAGLTSVGVQIAGSNLGALSGVDGRFTIGSVPADTVSLTVRRIGYQAKTVTGITVPANGAIEQHVAMEPASVELTAIVVSAAAERGTVNVALDLQRRATGIINAITSEQIARSPDSDAAQAVQRVSGVTVQDGRYVFVRGLGERYTTTSLNGARLPSPEPERKVVPLDLFPSGLLQTVTTSKTFTPDQPGDFSGAQVDIKTREFPAQRQFAYSASLAANDAAFGNDVFADRGAGGEAFALIADDRRLPSGFPTDGRLTDATPTEQNAMINSMRNVWTPRTRPGAANGSFSASLGGNDPLFGGSRRVGYLLSGTYSYTQEVATDQERSTPLTVDENGKVVVANHFTGSTGRTSVLWGGIANFSTMLGASSRLAWNNTYNRTADDEARFEVGNFEALPVGDADVTRMRYVQRSVFSSQLAGEHALGARHQLDWASTFSGVTRNEPDRSEVTYIREPGGNGGIVRRLYQEDEGAVRTYADLTERGYEGKLDYRYTFGGSARSHTLKLGGLGRFTTRDANNQVFGIGVRSLAEEELSLPAEQIFDGRFTEPNDLNLRLLSLGQGGSYDARDALGAGYAMVDYALTDRLRAIGGARLEASQVEVTTQTSLGDRIKTTPDFVDVLPSLALNYELTDRQNLRLSGSQTLARPEYRELAPVVTREVLLGTFLRGNAALQRTLIQNVDLRWEWYPDAGEIVSLALFGKRFDDPIERTYGPYGSSAIIDYVNADEAYNYGIELELRKSLGFITPQLAPFTASTNVTVMNSEIRLGDSQAASTDANRRMVGQSPYVVNAGLTYTTPSGGTSVTALYNRVGPRIREAGVNPLPNSIDEARNVVDLSLRFPLFRDLSGRFDARNLLNDDFVVTQGDAIRERYRAGRVYQLGLAWRP